MTHDAAVRITADLLPEMQRSSPEEALLKYARAEDLPPAQLEKLAQVFNAMSTLSHLEKSADKGSATHIIDVPTLVVSYAADIGNEPEKRAKAAPTHDPRSIDLRAALVAEVAGPRQVKEASAPAPQPRKVEVSDRIYWEAVAEVEAEAMLDMEKYASMLLRACDEGTRINFVEVEDEAEFACHPSAVKEAFDWLVERTGRKPVIRRAEGEKRASFCAGTAAGDAAVKFVEAHATVMLMRKDAAEKTRRSPFDIAAESTENPEEHDNAATGQPDRGAAPPPSAVGGQTATGGGQTATGGGRPNQDPGGSGKSKGDGGKSKDGEKEKDWSMRDVLEGAVNTAAVPYHAATDAVLTAANAADKTLMNVTSKDRDNKAQRRTDISVEDIRRAIALRRMIATDQVLREADPREVLEIYNSISRVNPELASDMTSLKLLLREAVSYEGMPLDSIKQLADIRKSMTDAEGNAANNDRRRYAVGGSNLPQLLHDATSKTAV